MKESFKVFLVCFCGAVIGGLFSYSALPTWWSLALGCVVGFVTGYIGYDVKGAVRGFVQAYRAVIGWKPTSLEKARMCLMLSILSSFSVMFLGWAFSVGGGNVLSDPGALFCIVSLVWWFSCTFYVAIQPKLLGLDFEERLWIQAKEMHALNIFVVLPVKLFFHSVKNIPHGLRVLRDFVISFIGFIHSSERVVCGLDATIGVFVAFMLRGTVLPSSPFSLIIGGFVGGIFGLVHVALAKSISDAFQRSFKAARARR